MEGRWTIYRDGAAQVVVGPDADGEVPVVPCDDAAIERGVNALRDRYGRDWKPERQAREDVLVILRAAGEAP
jgi:hypothetical protein